MAEKITHFFETQSDMLLLAGMLALVIVCVLQLVKMSRLNRQLSYLTDRLGGYLRAVLDSPEEPDADEQAEAFVSRQEQDMRKNLEQQRQMKRQRDAQVFDAVLSEIYP